MKRKISLVFLIWAILFSRQPSGQGQETLQPITIIESDDTHLVLELKNTSFNLREFITLKDKLRLPVAEMIFAIPAGTKPQLKIVDYQSRVFSSDLLNSLSLNEVIPENKQGRRPVEVESLDETRAKIKFHPVVCDPQNKIFEVYKYIKVEIIFKRRKPEKSGAKFLKFEYGSYKLPVDIDGIYRVTAEDLLAAGLDAGKLKPDQLAIFNKGKGIALNIQEVPRHKFAYLEFFGQANDSKYTLENVYWLVIKPKSKDENLVMGEREVSPPGGTGVDFYMEKAPFEENLLYQRSILGGAQVDHWFWKFLLAPNTLDVNFQLADVANVPEPAKLEVKLQGYSYTTRDPDHHILIYLNDTFLGEARWDNATQYVFETTLPFNYLANGANILRLEAPGDTGAAVDTIYLDGFTITYPRYFIARDNSLRFELEGYGKRRVEVSGFSQPQIELFDISQPGCPVRLLSGAVSADGDGYYKVTFSDRIKGKATYLILTNDKKKPVNSLIEDIPTGLLSHKNRADYVIIAPADFKEAVLPLANWRQNKGLVVKLVEVQDIYDEFNFGIFDPLAIKKFLRYAYNNWQLPPKYILLVGDASYDYKNYLGLGSRNFVPTVDVETEKMLAPSDNWFVCVDGEDNLPDMAIGRLPVSTFEELTATINKIIDYESGLAPAGWNRNLLFVADNQERIFEAAQDDLIANYVWPGLNIKKIYLSYYLDSAECGKDIINGINDGAFMVNYVGHGAEPFWAYELILKSSDTGLLTNYRMYPVVTAMTCLNTYFHYPYSWFNTVSEAFLKTKDKGVVGYWSSSGLTIPADQRTLDEGFYTAIFLDGARLLGDAVRQATAYLYRESPAARDLLKTIILLGDPALELDLPQ